MPIWEYVEAVVLGIIQGITEFLPISSSGHIVILGETMQRLTGMNVSPEESLQMNVALHLGTLFSILVVYRSDLMRLPSQRRTCAAILLATIPIVIVGFTLHDWVESHLQSPLVAGCGLLVTAFLLVLGQKLERNEYSFDRLSMVVAVVVGLFQVVALVPGISRSGSTISAGLMSGLRRETAAAFSFMIAIPAILGAVTLTVSETIENGKSMNSPGVLLVGVVVSFLVGWGALGWLLKLVSQRKLHWFAWYCALMGLGTIAWQLFA